MGRCSRSGDVEVSRTGRLAGYQKREIIRRLALPVWFAAITGPYLFVTDWYGRRDLGEGALIYFQVGGFATFLAMRFLATPSRLLQNDVLRGHGSVFLALNLFFIMVALQSLAVADMAQALGYVVVTYAAFVGLADVWRSSRREFEKTLSWSCFALWAIMIAAIVRHGFPDERWIGGFHPNHYGNLGLTAMMALFLAEHRLKLLAGVGAILAALMVQSRGTMLAAGVFLLVYYIFGLRRRSTFEDQIRPIMLAAVLISVGFGVILLTLLLGVEDSVRRVFLEVTSLYDKTRGLGTGMVGRTEEWASAFQMIADRPLVGYGFRAGYETIPRTHNAYLSLILQVGVGAAGLFVGTLVLRCAEYARNARRIHAFDAPAAERYRAMSAVIFAVLVNGVFEVTLINVGFPLSLMMILVLVGTRSRLKRARVT